MSHGSHLSLVSICDNNNLFIWTEKKQSEIVDYFKQQQLYSRIGDTKSSFAITHIKFQQNT